MNYISYLIPTNRGQEAIQRTLDTINVLDHKGFPFEICVYSREEITGNNVRWFPEEKLRGSSYGFNHMAWQTDSRFIAILTDDCYLPNPQTLCALVHAIENLGPERKMKIVGFSVEGGHAFYTPTRGQRFGNIIKLDRDLLVTPVARFPFIERATFNDYLNRHIFHPEFRMYGNDVWLGWWLGLNGEPFTEVSEARIYMHNKHSKNHEYEVTDCNTAYALYCNFEMGQKEYVCPEHPVYHVNRSSAPRKELLHWT